MKAPMDEKKKGFWFVYGLPKNEPRRYFAYVETKNAKGEPCKRKRWFRNRLIRLCEGYAQPRPAEEFAALAKEQGFHELEIRQAA
jgi:hypothetical protein